MKNRAIPSVLILIIVSFFVFFSCASSSEQEELKEIPVVEVKTDVEKKKDSEVLENNLSTSESEKTQQVGTMLPEIRQKTTYFEFSDPTIMEYAKKGSPSAIKNVVSKIRNPNGKYTEEEAVLLAVLHTVMTSVWTSEPVNFTIPENLPENVYTGIIDYVKKGIFDTNAGKSDFYTLVLPCVVLTTSKQTAFYVDIESNLTEALAQDGNSVLVHYLLGILYKQTDNPKKAFYHFETAYTLDSSCFEINYEYANALYINGDYQLAYDMAMDLQNPEDNNLDLLELCAKTALAVGKLDIAEEYVGKLLQKAPDDLESILLRAEILFEKEDYLRVSSLLDAYSKTDKTSVKYLLLRSKLQNIWNRNLTASVATITEALVLYPNNQDVLLWAANLALETGTPINGLSALELIAPLKELDKDNPSLLRIEVNEYIRQKDWIKAFEVIESLIKIDSSIEVRLEYISICIELNKLEAAGIVAEELYSDNKEDEAVQLAYIKTLIANKKDETARTLIDTLLPTASSKMKSSLYYQRSRIEKSEDKKLSSLRSSLTANPRNEEALFELYKLYFNKNDYRKAQYYLKQVIALNPTDEELLKLNSELESFLY